MNVHLEIDPLARGGVQIEDPISWPAFFALDGATLRSLLGDLGDAGWLHAPGPIGAREPLEWRRTLAGEGAAGAGWVGIGLMYTAGGADRPVAVDAYRGLVAAVRALAVRQSADQHELLPLLAAFGGRDRPDGPGGSRDLAARLRAGVDPDEVADEVGADLVDGLAAFAPVVEALYGPAPAAPSAPGRDPRGPGGPAVGGGGPGRPLIPGRPGREDGTVLAVTVQAWPVAAIPAGQPLEFRRALPARIPRAALRFSGRLRRSD